MPRYEFKDDKSSKFWDITLSGDEVTTNWGRIGTDGQSKTKSFADDAVAKKEYEKQIKSKTKKGYALAEGSGAAEAPSAAATSASNPELEAAIRANPDDQSVYQVYGDWLQAEGDPLGELVSVQCALAEADSEDLKKAEAKIFANNTEHFFGPKPEEENSDDLAFSEWRSYDKPDGWPTHSWTHGFSRTQWRYGFIHRLHFDTGYYDEEESRGEDVAAQLLAQVLAVPSARFIRELELGEFWAEGWEDGEGPQMEAAIPVIAAAPCAKTLRSIIFQRGEHDISGTGLDSSGLSDACPDLEELVVTGGYLTLGKLNFPKMKRFAAHTGGLGKAEMKAICGANMPNIEDLEVWFGSDNYGADCTVEDVAPLLEKELPKLKRLGLMNAEFGDAICKAVVASPLLPQLEVLDLSMGVITDEGAVQLIEARGRLAHLEKLTVRGYFSEDVATQLKTLAKEQSIEVEGDMSEDYRYVECSE